MSKLHELGGHKYTAGFLVAHSDERVKAAGRDILALIERVKKLDKQLQAARELAENVEALKPTIGQDWYSVYEVNQLKAKARELLKEDK